MEIIIPNGYTPYIARIGGENRPTHLYKGSFHKPEFVCNSGPRSILRNNKSKKGICKNCLKYAEANPFSTEDLIKLGEDKFDLQPDNKQRENLIEFESETGMETVTPEDMDVFYLWFFNKNKP